MAGDLRRAREYWLRCLSRELPPSGLPGWSPGGHAGPWTFIAPSDCVAHLRRIAGESPLLTHTALATALSVCLRHYNQSHGVVQGVPPALTADVPPAPNALPFFTALAPADTFGAVLRRTRDVLVETYGHQIYPYHQMLEDMGITTAPGSPTAFFDVVLGLEGFHGPLADVRPTLVLWATRDADGLAIRAESPTGAIAAAAVTRLFEHLFHVLGQGLARLDGRLADLPVITAAEEQRLLRDWNATARPVTIGTTVLTAFAAQAGRTPESPAVKAAAGSLTYRELDQRSNQLAGLLQRRGIRPDQLVGLVTERSLEMVLAIYGIVKAGAAYVPLDPELPADRLRYMIEDAQAPLILTLAKHRHLVEALGIPILELDTAGVELDSESSAPTNAPIHADSLAYMIYTSGSTGRPKGAMNTHAGLYNRIAWMQAAYQLTGDDVVLQKTPYSFDVSVWEFFWPLLNGATLVMADPGGHRDPDYIVETIVGERVTTLHFVPSMLRAFLEASGLERCTSLRHVICSGEALPADLVHRFYQRLRGDLHNLYGPTEAAIDVSHWPCPPDLGGIVVPIGWPIDNIRLYVVDQDHRLAAPGVAGELCIAGVGLARGYHRRPDLTADRFVPDPFSAVPGGRMYRTGDLARHRHDGSLEYLGRLDHQVKIRGFRIELGEIEAALLRRPEVKSAVVTAREDRPGLKQLVAYIVPSESGETDADAGESRVATWGDLYDQIYSRPPGGDSDPTFDTVSWDSAYTGRSIPDDEMRVWVDETAARILASRPRRVLEIGCGTGMILFRVAPHCEAYHGIDLAAPPLARIAAHAERLGLADKVSVERRPAHDLAPLAARAFDTIILNSVIQYFPSVTYLERVIEECVRLLAPGGRIFVGDVINFDLRATYYAYSMTCRADPLTGRAEVRKAIRAREMGERELFVAPTAFTALASRLGRLGRLANVEIQLKDANLHNEMSHFRYDVWLSTAGGPPAAPASMRVAMVDGKDMEVVADLRRAAAGEPSVIVASHLQNGRLQTALQVRNLTEATAGPATAGAILAGARQLAGHGHEPEDLVRLGAGLGYDVTCVWSPGSNDGAFDAVWRRRGDQSAAAYVRPLPAEVAGPPSLKATSPLQADLPRRLIPVIRDFLATDLPDYMVPSAFVIVQALPLSPNGKCDVKALPAPETTELATGEAGLLPTTRLEKDIAVIWEELLGVPRLGLHENLLVRGADSIVSLQALARLGKAGIGASLRELLENPTIAGQAAVARMKAETPRATAAEADGPVPLSPFQAWFFAQKFDQPAWWNVSLLLTMGDAVDPARLSDALQSAAAAHLSFRLRFKPVDGTWTQRLVPLNTPLLAVKRLQLEVGTPAGQAAFLQAQGDASRSLDLDEGPLAAALIVEGGPASGRLFLTIHHLIADAVSLRIFLSDVHHAYEQLSSRLPIAVPAPPATFPSWTRAIARYLAGDASQPALAFWRDMGRRSAIRLPIDHPKGTNFEADATAALHQLDSVTTTALLTRVPAAFGAKAHEAFLTALVLAVRDWAGPGAVRVDVEGHGRDDPGEELDLSRATGWFSSLSPVVLAGEGDQIACLMAVKETLRSVPQSGGGYAALRYLVPDVATRDALAALPPAELAFNYLGQLDASRRSTTHFGVTPEPVAPMVAPTGGRSHELFVTGEILDDRLTIRVLYSRARFRQATAAGLVAGIGAHLEALVHASSGAGAGAYSPADFPLAGLDATALASALSTVRGQIGSPGLGRLPSLVDLVEPMPAQRGMLFQSLLDPASGVYVMQMSCKIRGRLDVAALVGAWQSVLRRHAALRCAFLTNGLARPVTVVWADPELPVEHGDWRGGTAAGLRERLEDHLQADRERGFDLARAPLMRLGLFRIGELEHQLVWTHHHLILDGWSVARVLSEVFAAYAGQARGAPVVTPPPQSFQRYTSWLRRQDPMATERHWRDALGSLAAPTRLAFPPATDTSGGGLTTARRTLSPAMSQALQARAAAMHVTLATCIQGAWAMLLSRYGGQSDVVFGWVVATRPATMSESDQVVGLLINTLPLRIALSAEAPLESWLRRLQSQTAALEPFAHSPLVDIHGWSGLARGQLLFESIVAFENYPVAAALTGNLAGLAVGEVEWLESTNYPLSIIVQPGPPLALAIQFDASRFSQPGIDRALEHLETLLGSMATAAPSTSLGELAMANTQREALCVRTWNATDASFPVDACVHQLFERQAAKSPDRPAACGTDGATLTYADLDARANQLAHRLQALGAGPDERVGLCLPRGVDVLVAVLGILKSGAAFVTLDASYPAERLRLLAAETGACALVTHAALLGRLPTAVPAICLDRDRADIAAQPTRAPVNTALPASLAYVIFTSGSTGRPKGAMVPHGAFVNYLSWCAQAYQAGDGRGAPVLSSLSFDLPLTALFAPLLMGTRVDFLSEDDPVEALAAALRAGADYSLVKLTPGHLEVLRHRLRDADVTLGARVFVVGGEQLLAETVAFYRAAFPAARIVNEYGPTETVVGCCVHFDGPGSPARGPLPIGRPIANTQLHVLEKDGRPSPLGVPGELYIGGLGVGRGYLGRPDLTAERFVPDPFGVPGSRLYRTGDLVRYLDGGELEFLGRIDHQLKIRGFRIEPGEIEATLSQHPAVRQAVVIPRARADGEKELVAFIGAPAPAPDPAALRAFLGERLPEHMVPAAYAIADSLPLNANGKVDRAALWGLDLAHARQTYTPPRTPTEERLCVIWRDILGVERVGVDDDFFALGGHSLRLVEARVRLEAAFGFTLPLRTLFEARSVAGLAAAVDAELATDAALVAEIDSLSEEEVRRLLAMKEGGE